MSDLKRSYRPIIHERFGLYDLSEEEQRLIKEVDDLLLHFEFEAMNIGIFDTSPSKSMEHDLNKENLRVERNLSRLLID